jgi:hypothetical protein
MKSSFNKLNINKLFLLFAMYSTSSSTTNTSQDLNNTSLNKTNQSLEKTTPSMFGSNATKVEGVENTNSKTETKTQISLKKQSDQVLLTKYLLKDAFDIFKSISKTYQAYKSSIEELQSLRSKKEICSLTFSKEGITLLAGIEKVVIYEMAPKNDKKAVIYHISGSPKEKEEEKQIEEGKLSKKSMWSFLKKTYEVDDAVQMQNTQKLEESFNAIFLELLDDKMEKNEIFDKVSIQQVVKMMEQILNILGNIKNLNIPIAFGDTKKKVEEEMKTIEEEVVLSTKIKNSIQSLINTSEQEIKIADFFNKIVNLFKDNEEKVKEIIIMYMMLCTKIEPESVIANSFSVIALANSGQADKNLTLKVGDVYKEDKNAQHFAPSIIIREGVTNVIGDYRVSNKQLIHKEWVMEEIFKEKSQKIFLKLSTIGEFAEYQDSFTLNMPIICPAPQSFDKKSDKKINAAIFNYEVILSINIICKNKDLAQLYNKELCEIKRAFDELFLIHTTPGKQNNPEALNLAYTQAVIIGCTFGILAQNVVDSIIADDSKCAISVLKMINNFCSEKVSKNTAMLSLMPSDIKSVVSKLEKLTSLLIVINEGIQNHNKDQVITSVGLDVNGDIITMSINEDRAILVSKNKKTIEEEKNVRNLVTKEFKLTPAGK